MISVAKRFLSALDSMGPVGRWTHDALYDAALALRMRQAKRRGMIAHINREYERVFGRPLDLANPRTFNEKMQYLKVHGITDLHRRCADKHAVRDYVRSRIDEDILVPLHHVFDSADEIGPERIPEERFVIKATHDSGSTRICLDRKAFDWDRCRRRLRGALTRDFAYLHYEMQYHGLPRRILVEELLSDALDIDYKFFCFDGQPKFVGVNMDRRGDHRHAFMDFDWKVIPVHYAKPLPDRPAPKPATFDRMVDYAARLCAPFKFARADFYENAGRLYFSEITFHQYAGLMPFDPEGYDRTLGDLIRLDAAPDAVAAVG
jgi:hypothetical protein